MALPDPDSVVFIDKPNTTTPLSAAVLNPLQNRIFTRIQTLETSVAAVSPTGLHLSGLFSARPAASAGLNGVRFFATDKVMEFQCISAAWVTITVYAPEVITLPATPVDQQECIYVADTTNGIKWHFRYRAASASSFKWEAVGASTPLYSEVATDESTASTTYVDLATVGPSVTLPLAGDYVISFGGQVYNTTASIGIYVSAKLGAAAATDANGVTNVSPTASAILPVWRSFRRTGFAASDVIKLQVRSVGAGTARFLNRSLEVQPLRVG